MSIREIVETQVTQSNLAGKSVSGSPQFALMMSLFSQPGPSLINAKDRLNEHQAHAITRPMHFSQGISHNPVANIALLKALNQEPLAEGTPFEYDLVESLENQIHTQI
ncbi:hypothetical protein [Marinomonas sp. TW1]|uniref:hypothetical protein n=1 Tax=Marinomonas sp. TW1 TaxID=1561203 RepID=UPI0007AF45FC|nr:hypothetical protein [Marinomonas sp. TW1]KZN13531.1 hypothetical protein OA79_10905 [Marinomonas sp. TW1]